MAKEVKIVKGKFEYVYYEGEDGEKSYAGIEIKTKGGAVEVDEMLDEFKSEINGKEGTLIFRETT